MDERATRAFLGPPQDAIVLMPALARTASGRTHLVGAVAYGTRETCP